MTKRLLLIAPVFFGYYKNIIDMASNMGYQVDYICDSPSNSNIFKAISRVNGNFTKKITNNYFKKKVLPKIEHEKYDQIFMIGGMTFSLTPKMIGQMRKINKTAIFSLYQWDSEKNLPYVKSIHKYFDYVFTFDRLDASANKSKYIFLPLFYIPSYRKIADTNMASFQYDCMYVGTAHPKKFYDIEKMSKELRKVYPKQFIYHYMPSKLKYIYHKLSAPEYKSVKYSNFQSKKLSSEYLLRTIANSKCILDAPQAGQTGLTIRTIECLGAKRKLITTNTDIVNYDFYRPENIYIYTGKFDFNNVFFNETYQDIDPKIYDKYSLKNWLKTILENT